jgi:REP element-mobilizing transposase RayT
LPAAKPHSRDLRFGRISETGRIYHLRTSTEGGAPLFRDFLLGREVVRCMRFLDQRGDAESLAFVVMPNHLHWLVRLGRSRSLAQMMQSLKRNSARRVNQRLGRSGAAVWQPGFFDRALRAEDDLVAVARYIVANPLRADLCRHLGDYPLWDSVWL